MRFKTHVPNDQCAAVLDKLIARDLSIAEIVRITGVSRFAIHHIRAGNNSRRATFDKLAATLARIERQEGRVAETRKAQKAIQYFEERNRAYAKANASLWGRLKKWLIFRFQ